MKKTCLIRVRVYACVCGVCSVDLDGKILEKPGDTDEAFRMVK